MLLNDIFILWLIISLFIDGTSGVPCATATWSREAKTVAGGHGPGNKTYQLKYPYGLYINQNGTIFIADQDNHRIMKWEYGASHGTVVAGGNGLGQQSDQLYKPYDVTVDSKGTLFVTDKKRMTRWPEGAITGSVVVHGGWLPSIVLDAKEEYIYAADWSNNRIIKYAKNGTDSRIWIIHHIPAPWGIAIDKKGTIYAGKCRLHSVVKWTVNATEEELIAGYGGFGYHLDQLDLPAGIFVDQLGALYIADTNNNRIIRILTGSKTSTVIAGGNSQGNASHQLILPSDVTLDSYGNLYVSDKNNHRVQMFAINKNSCREKSTETTSTHDTITDNKFSTITVTIGRYTTSLFDTTTFTYICLFLILLGMLYLIVPPTVKQIIPNISQKEPLVGK